MDMNTDEDEFIQPEMNFHTEMAHFERKNLRKQKKIKECDAKENAKKMQGLGKISNAVC